MFVDLAGFTALTEAHGDETAVEILDEFDRCVRFIVNQHGLKEVKTIGDAFLLVGSDPVLAIEAALEMMSTIAARDRYPDVRIGIHEGEVVWRGTDIAGKAVNVAARVAAEATAGQILLTRRVVDLVGNRAQARCVGKRRLRHVPEEVELWDIGPSTDDARGVDPVCKMSLSPESAQATLRHDDRTYSFCSRDCLTAFLATPDRFST